MSSTVARFITDDFADILVLDAVAAPPAADAQRARSGGRAATGAATGATELAVTRVSRPAVAPRSSARLSRRQIALVVGGGLAGLLAGVDVILVSMLEVMLKGVDGDLLSVPGVAHAGWSAVEGVTLDFRPGAVIIVVAATLVGATIGWAVARYRRAASSRPSASCPVPVV